MFSTEKGLKINFLIVNPQFFFNFSKKSQIPFFFFFLNLTLFERKRKILIYLSNGSWTNDETLGKLDSSASAWTEQPEKQITYH